MASAEVFLAVMEVVGASNAHEDTFGSISTKVARWEQNSAGLGISLRRHSETVLFSKDHLSPELLTRADGGMILSPSLQDQLP